MREFAEARGLALQHVPADAHRRDATAQPVLLTAERADELTSCDHLLVYLTARTWTSGAVSERFAEEVERAMEAGVHLLLVHEMPGVGGQEVHYACKFESFFATTPRRLLSAGIYHEIAVAFKGGAWREASMVQLLRAVVAVGGIAATNEASMGARERPPSRPWVQLHLLRALNSVRRRRAAQASPYDIIQPSSSSSSLSPSSLEIAIDVEQSTARQPSVAFSSDKQISVGVERSGRFALREMVSFTHRHSSSSL